uniref:Uncharacterized protein n=1 Tax=Cupriavidus taiwanensis TaxID=164546 RepID=A0A375HFU4_9BURK|nr:protein of unknown function [Cupriavidus taiwanensis]
MLRSQTWSNANRACMHAGIYCKGWVEALPEDGSTNPARLLAYTQAH